MNHRLRIFTAVGFLCLCVMGGFPAETDEPEPILRAAPEVIDSWREMRFGMFIHWGPVTLSGKEIGWSRGSEESDTSTPWQVYDRFHREFNPLEFNADEWVGLAKQAGMKYVVLTTKHHDGFCLWDSRWTDYDIRSTPFQRDVVRELSDACKRQGLRFGPYFSICDWYQPDYGYSHHAQPGYTLDRAPEFSRYIEYLKNQVRELHEQYGPFHVFWFDGEWEEPWTHAHGVRLNNFCKQLQPDVLVNNRVDKGRQGMQGMFTSLEFAGDYGTPEQEIGAFNRDVPWETNMTIATQWAWKPNDPIKSFAECLRILIYTAGGDGNLLLNVSPDASGRIPEEQAQPLKALGKWMAAHGEGIYGTRGGPYQPGEWGASTCKENRIYLYLYAPEVTLPLPEAGVTQVSCLSEGELATAQEGNILTIRLKPEPVDLPAVVMLELKKNAMDVPVMNAAE